MYKVAGNFSTPVTWHVFFLTDNQREFFDIIVFGVLCSSVCVLGIVTNIINMIVFLKQGFSQSSNISFFGLAVSDLCCLITGMWFNVCMNPLLKHPDVPFIQTEMEYLTAGMPSICFSRITSWITVFITAERCLGIAVPLKVKQIVTEKRTAVAIISIYFLNILAILPDYYTYHLGWKFFPARNRSIIGLIKRRDDVNMGAFNYVFLFLTGFLSFVFVIIFTAVLVMKLEEKSAWRRHATQVNAQSESVSNRDKKTMKMIILIASVMIACYTPGTIVAVITIFHSEFSIFGQYANAFYAAWSLAFFAQDVNSSVNIFLYYRMSTKYKQTFHELFARCIEQGNLQ